MTSSSYPPPPLDVRHPSEPLDRFLADTEERLRSAADDAGAALERDSANALRRVPLACRDALRLRDDALALRSHLASVLQSLSQRFGARGESLQQFVVNHEDNILKGHGTTDQDGEVVATLCGVVERVNNLEYV